MRSLATSFALIFGSLLGCAPALAAEKPATSSVATVRPVASLALHAGPDSATSVTLRGPDARQQLLVTAKYADGATDDATRDVKYSVQPPEVALVTVDGLVVCTGNGAATITAKSADGKSATLSLTVERFQEEIPINFANSVSPVLTKAGCNTGSCHGKDNGQKGFRLSLFGYEPVEDYDHLVKEVRGRRLFPAAPEHSLILDKATGRIPHGGGKRMESGSDDYRLLVRWIAQGMPFGETSDPTVSRISVHPSKRIMSRGAVQQLVVLAHFSDGSVVDVSRTALYEVNEQDIAKINESGHIQAAEQPGDFAVMVRYQGKVGTFCATVPLGQDVSNLPPVKNYIDEQVFKKLKEIGMPPSNVSDDATFIRRVTIDIAGRLPTMNEVAEFQKDASEGKREKLIDRLLDSPEHADYFANKWSSLLRNKRGLVNARGTLAFHAWIRDSIAANKPYDQFVRELITASGSIDASPAVAWYRQVKEPGELVEDTAQLFMGVRLQCSKCHHDPFEKWSQQDYYGFSAFFSQVGRSKAESASETVIFHKRGAPFDTNPRTKLRVKPAGLGAPSSAMSADEDPRMMLAEWLTRKENPYFARSLVNRYWKHFLGRGIVDPEDNMRETNPPTNPELLDALARHFAEGGYNVRQLIRDICRSSTYQLSSEPNAHNAIDRQNFSRYYPKRLHAEVLLDAVNQFTCAETKFAGMPPGTRAVQLPDNSFNEAHLFLSVFGRPDATSACECERAGEPSLSMSLYLFNAKLIHEKIAWPTGRAAKFAADKRPDEQKIRELYLWAFSREPSESESGAALAHIRRLSSSVAAKTAGIKSAVPDVKPDKSKDKSKEKATTNETNGIQQAYEDILWALLNTKEFSFNH